MRWRYRAWWHLPSAHNPDNFATDADYIFSATRSLNILCIPEEAPMKAQSEPIASPEEWIR
jgi:hypothetical protein